MLKLKLNILDRQTLTNTTVKPLTDKEIVINELSDKSHTHSNLEYLEQLNDDHIDTISDASAVDKINELFNQPQQW